MLHSGVYLVYYAYKHELSGILIEFAVINVKQYWQSFQGMYSSTSLTNLWDMQM